MKSLVKNIVRQIGKWIEKVPVLCNIVLAFGMAFLLEVLGRQTFDQGVFGFVNDRTKMFLYSAFIIFVTYSVVLIVKRRLFTYIIVTLVWSVIGIVNFLMLSARNTPFTYVDVTLMKSVLPVMTNYYSPSAIVFMGALILIVLVLLVVGFLYLPKKQNLQYKRNILAVAVIFAAFGGTTVYGFRSNMLTDRIGNIRIAYGDYGTPYCFSITALKNGIDKPSNYSEDKIDQIEQKTKQAQDKKKGRVRKPNIIFVQLESHFDITQVKRREVQSGPSSEFSQIYEGIFFRTAAHAVLRCRNCQFRI